MVKTKVKPEHTVKSESQQPVVYYEEESIEVVYSFKYLSVDIAHQQNWN